MKIELKNVKHAKFASQETECFSAAVWIDGKKEGEVSNDGQGGSHHYAPWALADQLDAYAKTLPPVVCHFIDRNTGKPAVMPQSSDSVIDAAFFDWQSHKQFNDLIKTRFVWVRDGKLYQGQKYTVAKMKQMLADPVATRARINGAGEILNLLPTDAAFALFTKHLD